MAKIVLSDDASCWPSLPLAAWKDTCVTLHMWTQIVGKVRLALTPLVNHWWNVPLYVTARGLTTSRIAYGARAFELTFDFLAHQLVLETSEGTVKTLALKPQIVLLDEVMAGLNPAEIDQAVALVGKLSQRGLTIVIVEHVMRAIMAVARHIVVLDHGQKIAEGTPKEIVENPEVIRAYLGSYVHTPVAGAS